MVFLINNISYKEPSSPLLSERNNIPKEEFCPTGNDGRPQCKSDICRCVHLLKIPLGAMTQIIIVDKCKYG